MHPGATYVDAFLISWENQFFHAFPPFGFDCSLPAEDSHGEDRGHNDCSFMANSAMVLTAVTPDRGCSQDTFTTDHAQNAWERTRTTPTNQDDGSDGTQIIRESLAAQLISQKLKTSSSNLGGKELNNNTHLTLRGGFRSVIDNKLIVFPPMYPKR